MKMLYADDKREFILAKLKNIWYYKGIIIK